MRMRVIAAMFAALCVAASTAWSGERLLHVYTWSDYFDADVVAAFEAENKCRVAIDYFESNEAMYAKLKAGGGGYDIITPSSYMSAVMDGQGMLLPMNHALLSNLGNIDKSFLGMTEDPDMRYSVPYTRTVTGVGFNVKRVAKEDTGSWDIFGNPAYAKRMTMLNDMRETIGAALKYLGYSLNTTNETELAAAGEVLGKWKQNLAKFDVDEAKMGLGSGEFMVIHGYNGDVGLIMEESDDIDFYIPAEGSSVTSDDFVIAAGSANADLAHAFINHMLDPEVARDNMDSIRYYMPNPEAVAMLDPELRDSHSFNVEDAIMAKCEVIQDLGADNVKYIRIWDKVKADE